MSKFNIAGLKNALGRGPIVAETVPTGRTHEGGAGYAHDDKSELFLLAVAALRDFVQGLSSRQADTADDYSGLRAYAAGLGSDQRARVTLVSSAMA